MYFGQTHVCDFRGTGHQWLNATWRSVAYTKFQPSCSSLGEIKLIDHSEYIAMKIIMFDR